MTYFPDDLPRSPTGRGRGVAVALGIVAVVLAVAWWWDSGAPGLRYGVGALLDPDRAQGAPVPPSAEAIAFADEAHLTEEGRQLLFDARPEFLGAEEFVGRCVDDVAVPRVRADGAVGCYSGGANSIVVYVPADPRLRGFAVETVAHEALHAAWDRLAQDERDQLTPVLEAEVAATPADDLIHQQIAGSVGDRPENRPTELFAYLGTQIWHDGGLHPRLETVYTRYIADRAALVAVHDGWRAMLDGLAAEIDLASQALTAQEAANGQERAQLTADAESVEFYRRSHQEKVAELAAMPAEQREGLRLSWEWWDGTRLPMAPADQTLATSAKLLARDDADLPARDAAIRAAEEAAAAERARVQALVDDLNGLQAQLDPTPAG